VPFSSTFLWAVLALAAAVVAYAGIALALPWLKRRAVAPLTSRSSHEQPTPQGAGIVLVPVALGFAAVALTATGEGVPGGMAYALAVAAGALLLMLVGFIDDVRPLGIAVRLGAQAIAVGLAVLLAPAELRVLPDVVPLALERAAVILAGLWFVNLFNFMDGIDWISATETIAITLGVVFLTGLGVVPGAAAWIAAALLGAMLGFLPWNAPPARVFLGDAGSLPIGFLLGVLLFHTAAAGAVAAALILPMYYVADASLTLVRRLLRGERVWQPHREHFYQHAVRGGFTVRAVIVRIAGLDASLVVLAVLSLQSRAAAIVAVMLAALAVAFTLRLLKPAR
jgi:UDP-N-acetylmuramyl pentapeptide phosphotransferase/UDP-N-acetylglucosamine-1-phosphate transferase